MKRYEISVNCIEAHRFSYTKQMSENDLLKYIDEKYPRCESAESVLNRLNSDGKISFIYSEFASHYRVTITQL